MADFLSGVIVHGADGPLSFTNKCPFIDYRTAGHSLIQAKLVFRAALILNILK